MTDRIATVLNYILWIVVTVGIIALYCLAELFPEPWGW